MLAFSDIIDFLLRLMGDETTQRAVRPGPAGHAGSRPAWRASPRRTSATRACSSPTPVRSPPRTTAPGCSVPAATTRSTRSATPARTTSPTRASARRCTRRVDHGSTLVTIDDRDTLFFQSISDDDVTVTDNSVAITDSFNQDNSDDDLTAIQDNSDDDTTINADDSSTPPTTTSRSRSRTTTSTQRRRDHRHDVVDVARPRRSPRVDRSGARARRPPATAAPRARPGRRTAEDPVDDPRPATTTRAPTTRRRRRRRPGRVRGGVSS